MKRWLLTAAAAGVVTALLYLPFALGAKTYWSRPERPSVPYARFVAESFRHAQAGQGAPGLAALLLPILACTAGAAPTGRCASITGEGSTAIRSRSRGS